MTKLKSYERVTAVAVGLVFVSLIADMAIAQTPDPGSMIARADANGDGDIAWAEMADLRTQTFAKLDRNGDGGISTDDTPPRAFAARFNEAFEQLRADFDGDSDGQITQTEMLEAPAPMFEKGDVDGDGVLTAEEMAALRTNANPS